MPFEKLSKYISEYSIKNKSNYPYPVYSVTNSNGFCTGYFDKDVSSDDKKNYKIVPFGCFAYNPSRINVGSIDWQHCEENVIVSPLYVVFKCSDRLFQPYLLYFLKSDLGHHLICSNVSGSVRFNLKFKTLGNFNIKIVSLEEQKEIVKRLDSIKKEISLANKELDLLEEMKTTHFIEMFGKEIESNKKMPFEEICEFVTVGIANSATHAFSDNGVVMLRNQNIKENYLDDSDIVFIKDDFAKKYRNKTLKENDLLIVRTGYPGICCVVPKKYEGAQTFTTLIARLKKDIGVNPFYVSYYINSKYGKEFVEKNQVGAAQQNFGATALSLLPIYIPSIDKQNAFELFANQIDKAKFIVQERIVLLKELLNKKMDEYFGENE